MNTLYLGSEAIIRAKLKVYRTQAKKTQHDNALKKLSWKKCKFTIQQSNVTLINCIAGIVGEKNKMLFKNRKSKILCLVKSNPLQKHRLKSK